LQHAEQKDAESFLYPMSQGISAKLSFMRRDRYFLRREDRLRDSQTISRIFNREGNGIHAWPLSLFYLDLSGTEVASAVQAMFVVPKRKIKKQVQRQRIKRQMRECYRLQKPELLQQLGSEKHFALVWFYAAKEPVEQAVIVQSFNRLFHDFTKRTQ
jgi:ribonuclease P protein component